MRDNLNSLQDRQSRALRGEQGLANHGIAGAYPGRIVRSDILRGEQCLANLGWEGEGEQCMANLIPIPWTISPELDGVSRSKGAMFSVPSERVSWGAMFSKPKSHRDPIGRG